MSTFHGKVAEFPDIRIDYFRGDCPPSSSSSSSPPLAFFLSHVHSDHLLGLERKSKIFTYCTPATRDILLRLEKYPHRMNFAKGILETRVQSYRHQKDLVKAIALEVPTEIDLAPGRKIQVTAFDANHCVGACMFLIEGDGNAILYTGDIRSEVWWVNSIVRNPILLPYACPSNAEPIKRLDCIYLDTTFVVAGKEDPYRDFASKAEGLHELLQKVAQYPSGTNFYFDSWTFGYEDVWQALSQALDCQVHLDDYRIGLYQALQDSVRYPKAPEAQKMIGYRCGNHDNAGYLTWQQSRLHSCEKGTGCDIWNKDFVRITPIVSRYQGVELAELGAGGGRSDLNQNHELHLRDTNDVGDLMNFCAMKLQDSPGLLAGVLQVLVEVMEKDFSAIKLEDFMDAVQMQKDKEDEAGSPHIEDADELPLANLVPALAKVVVNGKMKKHTQEQVGGAPPLKSSLRPDGLPKHITFPYSRHSSYNELRCLIGAFKPKDIFPCTVDERNWNLNYSMGLLFGDMYQSPPSFRHDTSMWKMQNLDERTMNEDARPGSTSSTSAAYVTPTEEIAESRHQEKNSVKRKRGSSDEQNGSKPRPKRSKKLVHGDYWPPLQVDHYEPSAYTLHNHKYKPPTHSEERVEAKAWSNAVDCHSTIPRSPLGPSHTETLPRYKHAQIQKSLKYDRTAPHTNFLAFSLRQNDAIGKQRSARRQPNDHGRLSPPPTANSAPDNRRHATTSSVESATTASRHLTSSLSTNHNDNLSPAAKQRLAFRQEAYDAVLESGGSSWQDIGLVSVSGHQAKEEEL